AAASSWLSTLSLHDALPIFDEDLDLKSLWGKFARETGFGRLDVTLNGYRATWRPTEQIPERAIGTAVCADEFCSLDPSATGETRSEEHTSELQSRENIVCRL